MRGRFAAQAPRQAMVMLAALERDHPGALAALRADPLGELQRWPQIRVCLVSETDGSRCSVAGSYQHATSPPALLVSRSRSVRRRGFTGLHELGHHLQQTDLELGQRLFAVEDSEELEEEACDAFAARVLLPDDQVAAHIDPRGPTATSVAEMFHSSRASREACCVRAAEHLTGAGVVVLLDTAGTVLFAAPRGFIPPARGSVQSGTPLITAALRGCGTVERDRTVVLYRDGSTSDQLYGQAAWCDEDYLIAVLVSDNAAWRRFAPPRPDTGRSRWGSWWTCETCGREFRVTQNPCERCGDPRCEEGHCGCTVKRAGRDRTCDTCYLTLSPSRFAGVSTTCRDCAI
jgi:Zn-dependent peptidase ImmA (M78 family)